MAETSRELIERYVRDAEGIYDQIRNDTTRTTEWKRKALAREYLERKAELDKKLESLEEASAAQLRKAEQRTLGIEGIPGDQASLMISRRDAADRVERLRGEVNSSEAARALLDRADRTGDEVLARAVASWAVDNGDAQTVNAFVSTRPNLNDDMQLIWDSRVAGGTGWRTQFHDGFLYATLRPNELPDNDWQIKRIAEQDETKPDAQSLYGNPF